MYPHFYEINGLIINDGWVAYSEGQKLTDNPYKDDPISHDMWEHGFKKAEEYFNWKDKVVDKWSNKSND